MTTNLNDDPRVLAIDPTSRGFGFVVLEGPGSLIDWGTKDTERADSELALRLVGGLVDRYRPDVLVVEDVASRNSRRRSRARELIEAVTAQASSRRIEVARVSREQVQNLFRAAGATTKHGVASVIAEHFPELAPHVPPRRKAWMSEDSRMAIFDAAGFGLAYYFHPSSIPSRPAAKLRGFHRRGAWQAASARRAGAAAVDYSPVWGVPFIL